MPSPSGSKPAEKRPFRAARKAVLRPELTYLPERETRMKAARAMARMIQGDRSDDNG